MQKNFIRTLSVFMAVAMILSIALIYVLQTVKAQGDAADELTVQLDQVKKKISDNAQSILELTNSINADSLAKCRAFRYMVQKDPAILGNQEELDRIKQLLNVDELHVTDEKGVLRYGTEPSMFGFDFGTADQTKPFLDALDAPSFELAQDAQLNGTYGVLFQYIGVARQDTPGIIQIGMRPERLENALKSNEISNLLSTMRVGTNGYIFAVSTADSTILAHKNEALIGKNVQEAGLPADFTSTKGSKGFMTVDGTNVYCLSEPVEEMVIAAVLPRTEVYGSRNIMTVIFAAAVFLIFSVLMILINRLLRQRIVDGISTICRSLSQITGGDLRVTVNVHTCKEFSQLSSGINEMVSSIQRQIHEMDDIVKSEQEIFGQVRGVSGNINEYAGKMLSISQGLTQGARDQKQASELLSGAFREVSRKIADTATRAENAYALSRTVKSSLNLGNQEMVRLVESMGQISEHSQKISSILKSIDEISFQTNIIALNAAVEAAHAGEAGKGFAVVADEVRRLAVRSAESAKDTASLIGETLQAVEEGTRNAANTSETLLGIISDADRSADFIRGISEATQEENDLVSNVEQEIEHISAVIESNSQTAQESETASEGLSAQVDVLKQLVATPDSNKADPIGSV